MDAEASQLIQPSDRATHVRDGGRLGDLEPQEFGGDTGELECLVDVGYQMRVGELVRRNVDADCSWRTVLEPLPCLLAGLEERPPS
jgi:hypothetical protein